MINNMKIKFSIIHFYGGGAKMNKKGGEKLLSIWWFLVLAIVGTSIVVAVWIFYGAGVDTRGVEAELLANKVLGCFSQEGYLPKDFLSNNFSVFDSCGLSKTAFDVNGPFYFRVSFFDSSGNKLREDVFGGNRGYETDCAIASASTAARFPVCTKKNETGLYYMNGIKQAKIEVLAGSNQEGKKFLKNEDIGK